MTLASFHPLVVFYTVGSAYGFSLMTLGFLGKVDWLVVPRFSHSKFYVLMGWAPLTYVALAVILDPRYFALFVAAGLLGIAGELAVAWLWRTFFRVPIWTYSYNSVLAGHTSTLNFLPWAIGALLLHTTARLVGALAGTDVDAAVARPMLVATLAFSIGAIVAWPLRRFTRARALDFSKPAFAVFCLPIATVALALGVFCDPAWLAVMLALAVVGFLTEYGYGRSMSLFFEQGLWTYNHWKIDSGHTSFVTLPLWALGGLYFHFIAVCLGL
jgi:hypothetical protein